MEWHKEKSCAHAILACSVMTANSCCKLSGLSMDMVAREDGGGGNGGGGGGVCTWAWAHLCFFITRSFQCWVTLGLTKWEERRCTCWRAFRGWGLPDIDRTYWPAKSTSYKQALRQEWALWRYHRVPLGWVQTWQVLIWGAGLWVQNHVGTRVELGQTHSLGLVGAWL